MFWQELLNAFHDFVVFVSKEMPLETDWEDSLAGSWYISPMQHAVEFIVINICLFLLFFKPLRVLMQKGGYYRQQFQKFQPKVSKATDYVIMSLLLLSYATVVSHKRAKNALLFLFQPCHITLFLLILLMLLPVTWIGTHIAFNVILCNVWGTTLALFFPDLRDYNLFFEVEMYWIEHVALLLVPIWLAYKKRFNTWPATSHILGLAVLCKCLYHSLLLECISLWTGRNLNYVLSPPPGILTMFGPYYKMLMYAGAGIFCYLTRAVLVESVFYLFGFRYDQLTPKPLRVLRYKSLIVSQLEKVPNGKGSAVVDISLN